MDEAALFEHASSFEAGEASGHLQLGRLEACYEELFADVIEDGVITADERAELDRTADRLGLDRRRIHELERALGAAYEARHRRAVRDDADGAAASIAIPAPSGDATAALRARVRELEARVEELERALEEARAQAAIEVDLSGIDATPHVSGGDAEDDPAVLARRVRQDAGDLDALHALYRAATRVGERDRALSVARVLVHLGAADDEEKRTADAHPREGLIRPASALGRDAWRRHLYHPDEEPVVGDIFASIISALLLGRVAVLRQQKALPALDPSKRLDPTTSTVAAARCFGWAAAILGLATPLLHADAADPGLVSMIPALPPAVRLGKLALSGRSPAELAFLAGRELAYYRDAHFVRRLLPSVVDLEDVFLAALTIGSPGLPLGASVKSRVEPIARAIEPILEPAQIDRLRGHFLRFVEDGGRANLQRWATAVDRTAARAGLLLSDDLGAAERILTLEGATDRADRMSDLVAFAVSDRHSTLRKQLGIAIA
jgi:hypothetical protein